MNTPEGSADLITLAALARPTQAVNTSAYTLTGLEMNLYSEKRSSQRCGHLEVGVGLHGRVGRFCFSTLGNIQSHAS